MEVVDKMVEKKIEVFGFRDVAKARVELSEQRAEILRVEARRAMLQKDILSLERRISRLTGRIANMPEFSGSLHLAESFGADGFGGDDSGRLLLRKEGKWFSVKDGDAGEELQRVDGVVEVIK